MSAPLTVNSVLRAFAGLKIEKHGFVDENLKVIKTCDGPHPAHMEVVVRCVREGRFDLLEKAASIRRGNRVERRNAQLISTYELASERLPNLAKNELFEIFELIEPVLAKTLPKSEKQRQNVLRDIGLQNLPQGRGNASDEYRAFVKELGG